MYTLLYCTVATCTFRFGESVPTSPTAVNSATVPEFWNVYISLACAMLQIYFRNVYIAKASVSLIENYKIE